MNYRRRLHNGAFTLIEVLVVVAIIALLVGILLPSLAKARQQGRKAVCLNNVKQLSMAFFYYSGDYNGKLPHFNYWLFTGDPSDPNRNYPVPQSGVLMGRQTRLSTLQGRNYAKDPAIYKCPSDQGARTTTGAGGFNPIIPPTFSYTLNAYVMSQAGFAQDPNTVDNPGNYMPLNRVKRAAETPLLIEEYEFSPMNDGYFVSGIPSAGETLWDRITTRHGGRTFSPEVTVANFGKALATDHYGIGVLGYYDFHAAPIRSWQFNLADPGTQPGRIMRHHFLAPGFALPSDLKP